VFGDGSVVIISTPAHTPGHQSLLVRLPKTGTVVLSGDAVHFKANWDNRRVPPFNTDKDKTLASMQRIADIVAKENGQLWINHDKPQTDCHWSAPVGLSTAGQRFNRGSFRGQGPEVAAPENDELRNRLLCG
jgi:N-acyl homoserine lactone hydrolase